MKRLSELDPISIAFGDEEEIYIDDELNTEGTVEVPVIVNGIEYSTDEIKLCVEPIERNIGGEDVFINRIDIWLKPEFRHKGYGYNIYKSFVMEFGNIYSPDDFRKNNNEVPNIYAKLAKEPGINVQRTNDFYFAYSDEWKSEYGDGLKEVSNS